MSDAKGGTEAAVTSALVVGVVLVGAHVACKATNDALFLSTFPVSSLPTMLIASSIVSLLVVLGTARLMVRLGPSRVVPRTFLACGAFMLLVWALSSVSPKAAAVAFFFHTTALGAILVSGFWSMVNERFDPHTAKRKIGRIAMGTAIGGVLGGLVAGGVATGFRAIWILPLLAGAYAFCGWRMRSLSAPVTRASSEAPPSARKTLVEVPFVRHLAAMIGIGSIITVLLEYVFKLHASARYTDAEGLMRFFSMYYFAVAVCSLVAQGLCVRPALERMGLAGAVGSVPVAGAVGATVVLAVPALATASGTAFLQAVLENSLFRSAYELFYIPLPAAQKRSTKTLIDVGMKRLGEALGGGVTKTCLVAVPSIAVPTILGLAIGLAGVQVAVILWLKKGYVSALRRCLVDRAFEAGELDDELTRTVVLQTAGMAAIGARAPAEATRSPSQETKAPSVPDPVAQDLIDLKCGDLGRVQEVLRRSAVDPTLMGQVIRLVGWNEVSRDALALLNRSVVRIPGQIADALLDPDEEFSIRRRVPFAFVNCDAPRVIEALLSGLGVSRFEVRFSCSRVLSRIRYKYPEASMSAERVWQAVLAELEGSSEEWGQRSLLDNADEVCPSLFVDEALASRAERTLEHVFALMSLVQELSPLQVAYRGLHTADEGLRGTALEYLEVVLPDAVRGKLVPRLERGVGAAAPRDPREARDRLMQSSQAIDRSLEEVRKRMPGPS